MQLKEALQGTLSHPPSQKSVREYIAICHRIALLYVRKKIRTGSLNSAFFGLSVSDIAIDCLASLFTRDVNGAFHQLHAYYAGIGWEEAGEDQLLAHTRRLVFSSVNQQIYRLFKEEDPSLDKLLRNLRSAIKKTSGLTEERIGNHIWIRTRKETERSQMLPAMPPEFLEGRLAPLVRDRTSLAQVARHTMHILDDQAIYRKSYGLVPLALSVRSIFARMGRNADMEPAAGNAMLRAEELEDMIAHSVAVIERRMHHAYVGRRRIHSEQFAVYLHAIRASLQAQFGAGEDEEKSLYQHLTVHMPDLTHEQYHKKHRCYVEYLLRMARLQFLEEAAEEFVEMGS